MITEKTFSDLLADIDLNEPMANSYAASECFEKSKQLAIDFSNFGNSHKCNHSPLWGQKIWADNEGNEISTDELFNLYLKSQK